ncbi:Hpt domain-containing protein [Paludibacterium yongneupense]|uniref:Hpt domain-containing protein n=1 Tax=Paludibacterium yongneupense TaxID=400061 RepID=UPI0009FD0E9E|nr:Hpt domain-containing protein [Paludibacterium yongneupense]
MNIRHRITMLVVLSFVAISAIGGYAVFQSRGNASEVKTVTEGIVPSTLASSDLVAQLKDVQLATMNLIAAPDQNIAQQAQEQLTAGKARLQAGLDYQLKHADSATQRGLIQEAHDSLQDYFSSIDDAARFKLAGKNDLANATFYAGVSQYQVNLQQNIQALRVEKSRSTDAATAALNQNLSRTVTTLSGVTLITVLALFTMGILLYRQITRPISRMQHMMSEIATSQDFTRRVPVDQQDEIGKSIIAFNTMIAKIEENSILLKQKTNDIQTMLQNIPQGILTLTEGGLIHHEYSAHLESILETRDIAGRTLPDLVFSDTTLGSDILSQIDAAVGSCIGEDVMNYEFNEHLLVGEIEKRMPDGRVKILDLNWSPITDDADTVVRLILCVRDVTELRKLAAEANEQKRELEIIGEILAVSQDKFHEFIAGAIKFVDENEQLIREHAKHDSETIAQLFRNMHTIKGNARTYGLHNLTNIVHEAEQTYDALRKPNPDIAWDPASLREELAGVRAAIDRYARINEVSLGRKGPGRRGSIERYLMVEKAQIQETLHRLETVNTGNLHELIAARNAVHKILRLLGTEEIEETLAGLLESLPSLADELGKETPLVKIVDNGYVVRNQASGTLKNVFMHLFRNSMDHGLESPDERVALGKPVAGTIRLAMNVVDKQLQLRMSDDGRGLALGRIRERALDKGLIEADAALSDEEIARLIFRPGFSTAAKVTEVSGRGVGMDAVQSFIKREGGQITLRFLDEEVGADFRRFETVVCLPENIAIAVDAGAGSAATAAASVAEAKPAQQNSVAGA